MLGVHVDHQLKHIKNYSCSLKVAELRIEG